MLCGSKLGSSFLTASEVGDGTKGATSPAMAARSSPSLLFFRPHRKDGLK